MEKKEDFKLVDLDFKNQLCEILENDDISRIIILLDEFKKFYPEITNILISFYSKYADNLFEYAKYFFVFEHVKAKMEMDYLDFVSSSLLTAQLNEKDIKISQELYPFIEECVKTLLNILSKLSHDKIISLNLGKKENVKAKEIINDFLNNKSNQVHQGVIFARKMSLQMNLISGILSYHDCHRIINDEIKEDLSKLKLYNLFLILQSIFVQYLSDLTILFKKTIYEEKDIHADGSKLLHEGYDLLNLQLKVFQLINKLVTSKINY